MRAFTRDHVFILPHADEYRRFYDLRMEDVLMCLNAPDTHEGLANERYTAEKQVGDHQIYVYYYRTLPLCGNSNEYYAIVDFIGYSAADDQPSKKENREGTNDYPLCPRVKIY